MKTKDVEAKWKRIKEKDSPTMIRDDELEEVFYLISKINHICSVIERHKSLKSQRMILIDDDKNKLLIPKIDDIDQELYKELEEK